MADQSETSRESTEETALLKQRIRVLEAADAERRLAEECLADESARRRILMEQSRDGIVILDQNGQVYESNRKFADMLGYPLESMRRLNVIDWECFHPPERLIEMIRSVDEKGDHFETKHRRRDGSTYDAEISTNAAWFDGQKLIFCVCRDITERKILLELLSRLNQKNGLRELLKQVTELMKDWSGCDAVGIRLQEGYDFPYFETQGFPPEFLLNENSLCAVDIHGGLVRDTQGSPVLECMCGNVICGRFDPELPFFTEKGTFWTNSTSELLASFTEAERQARTRNRCNGEGYQSVALIPLRYGDHNLGLLQFNDHRPNRFNDAKIVLFENLAANLAIGLVQRRTAEALSKSEQKYRTLVEQSVSEIYLHDLEGNILEVNQASVNSTGYSKDELLCMNVFGLHPDRFYSDEILSQWRTWPVGKPLTFETQHKSKGGRIFPVEIKASKIQMDQKQYILALVHDITERKRVEKELINQKIHFESLFTNTNDAIVFTDIQHRVININEQFTRLFGYDLGEIKGMNINKVVDPDETAGSDHVSQRVLRGEKVEMEVVRYRKNGESIDVLIKGAPVLIEGRVVGGYAIYVDVSEKKRAEEALRQGEASIRKKLQVILEPEGDMGELDLSDIIDQQALQAMMDDFYRLKNIGSAVVDLSGKVLVATGWQDVCTKFHRVHPESLKNCKESDVDLSIGVDPGTFKTYRCKNNLRDMVTPIFVGDKHMGNIYLGQFFYDDEAPDYELFRSQARQYGFDETEYISAVERVPRFSRETLEAVMDFYAKLAGMISNLSFSTVKLARTLSAQERSLVKLAESENNFKNFFENMADMIFVASLDGQILHANQSACNVLGYSVEEIKSKHILDLHLQNDHREAAQTLQEMVKGDRGSGSPPLAARSGTTIPVDTRIWVGNWNERKCMFVISRNLTSRRELEQRFERIFDSNPAPMAISSLADRKFVQVNDAFLETMGYRRQEVIGKTPADLKLFLDREQQEIVANQLIDKGRIKNVEMEVRCKDGSVRNGLFSGEVIRNQGRVFLLTVMMDTTDRKHFEAERESLQAQLHQAQKMEAIGTLAGGIAHDFNNILSAVMGYSEMAQAELPRESDAGRYIEQVLQASNRAKDLVKQILAFSRHSDEDMKPLKAGLLLEEAVKLLRASIPSTIEIRTGVSASRDTILANATQIHQVIMNLCTNAYHAMHKSGGVLDLSLREVELRDQSNPEDRHLSPGSYLLLAVSDTGCGMSPEVVDRIFDPYFTTKEKDVGTGLGLSVVHGIVKRHGGDVRVFSEPGKGTEFHVLLPVLDEVVRAAVEPHGDLPRGSGRILFVDDEVAIADIGMRMLGRQGYHVEIKTSSIEALELFRSRPHDFDLLITDMTMPHLRGDGLAHGAMEIRPDIPVILCTGYSDMIDEEKARETGIRCVLKKPVGLSELAQTVYYILTGKDPGRGDG